MANDQVFEALQWALPHLPYDFSGLGLYLNAHLSEGLARDLVCVQPHRGKYAELQLEKYSCAETPPDFGFSAVKARPLYDFAWIEATPNEQETLAYLAMAAQTLKSGAPVVLSAANNAGGSRYQKLGFPQSMSKHKCRIVAGPAPTPPEAWLASAGLVKGEHGYWTQPGIFGWNKIDAGSRLLVECLPAKMAGAGADFGAGYGYLSMHLADRGCTQWHLYEVDRRAVEAARKNMEGREGVEVYWQDVTVEPARRTYDWIVVNPPFHRDGKVSFELGVRILEEAIRNLRKGAELWVVAHNHLPYELLLQEKLGNCVVVRREGAFKVLQAGRTIATAPPGDKPRRREEVIEGFVIYDEEESQTFDPNAPDKRKKKRK